MRVVEQLTHAPVECANAAQMMRVVIRVKHVALDLACAVLLHLVLGNLLEHIVMLPITYANAHQRWMHVLLEKNVQEALVFVSNFAIACLLLLKTYPDM